MFLSYSHDQLYENVRITEQKNGTRIYNFNRFSRDVKYKEFKFGQVIVTQLCMSNNIYLVKLFSCEELNGYNYKGIVIGQTENTDKKEINVDNCLSANVTKNSSHNLKQIKIDNEDLYNMTDIEEFKTWLIKEGKNIVWRKPSNTICKHVFKNGNNCKSYAYGLENKCKRHA